MTRRILIMGSGPDAVACRNWDLSGYAAIVAINNAWQLRPDWTHLIHPEDFPPDRMPDAIGTAQQVVTAQDYIPCQNRYGGVVYAGGTMAFTTGYWALSALQPDVMAYVGCDMVYPATGRTHFYGTGTADPLRPDVTLQDLEAKSARLMLLAERAGCRCVNLSTAVESRLVFPRAGPDDLPQGPVAPDAGLEKTVRAIRAQEEALGQHVPSGRYWEVEDKLDPAALARIDGQWRATHATRAADRAA